MLARLDSVARRPAGATGSYPQPSWIGSCDRALHYWELLAPAAQAAQADPQVVAALLTVEGSGERSVSPAGALGLMQLLPDKFRSGDDPFHVETNLRRAAEHVALLQGRWGSADRVAAAYFGAIDGAGNVTSASDGNVNGLEYVRRFQASLACVRSGLGVPGETLAALVSPLGSRLTPNQVSFGFLDDYGPALASYVRGAHGVQRYGTLHLGWDLIVPGAPNNGRGYPVFAPLAGRIVRTSDPVGGPNGLWIESDTLNLRGRLMHLDTLAPNIADGVRVHAGQWVGTLGGQGTEDFPHLHFSLELLSSGARLDPAQFYFRGELEALAVADLGANGAGAPTLRLAGLGKVERPRTDGSSVVWLANTPDGPLLRGLDVGSGWGFRVGSVDAVRPSDPAVSGETVAWLDRRQIESADDERADIYAYDLQRGQERRLSDYSGHYVDLTVDGSRAAWIDRREQLGYVEVYDLVADTRRYIGGSLGQPRELTLNGSVLAWVDDSTTTTGGDDTAVQVYDLSTDRRERLAAKAPSEPAVVGDAVFWLDQPTDGPGQLIRGHDLKTGRDWTITPTAAQRWGLRASDGQLIWQELRPDDQSELVLYGLASDERLVLADRRFGSSPAALGRGTVAWSDATDALIITTLPEWDLPNGRFFAEPGDQRQRAARTGFSLTNQSGVRLWDEYRRLGGTAVLGRPITERIRLPDGWYYQATERALLQWRPELDQAVALSPLEWLQSRADAPSQASGPEASAESLGEAFRDLISNEQYGGRDAPEE